MHLKNVSLIWVQVPCNLPWSIVVQNLRKTIKRNPDINLNPRWLPTLIQHDAQLAVSFPAGHMAAAIASSSSYEKWPCGLGKENCLISINAMQLSPFFLWFPQTCLGVGHGDGCSPPLLCGGAVSECVTYAMLTFLLPSADPIHSACLLFFDISSSHKFLEIQVESPKMLLLEILMESGNPLSYFSTTYSP